MESNETFNPDDLNIDWNKNSSNTIISPVRKQYHSDSDGEEEDVKPPSIENLNNSPRIKLMTPIRKKKDDMDIPKVEQLNNIYINRSPLRTPRRLNTHSPLREKSPDIVVIDDEEINEKVMSLVSNPMDVDYTGQSNKIKELCIEAFKTKYANLKLHNKEYDIVFPEGKKLNRIHKIYHSHVKDIFVSLNLGQIQIGYIVGIMGLEIFCIKILGIPMAGFTRLELKRMYKYHSMMIEFGHTMYNFGGAGDGWSLEWRMGSTFLWNIFLFLGVKMLSKYIGGDSMIEVIRDTVDQIVENPVSREDVESGNINKNSQQNDMNGLFNMFGGGEGGDDSGIADLIANMGTSMTENMENSKKKSTKKNNKKRFIFDE